MSAKRGTACFKCGEEGHWANKCTNIANRGQANTGKGTQANTGNGTQAMILLCIYCHYHCVSKYYTRC